MGYSTVNPTRSCVVRVSQVNHHNLKMSYQLKANEVLNKKFRGYITIREFIIHY